MFHELNKLDNPGRLDEILTPSTAHPNKLTNSCYWVCHWLEHYVSHPSKSKAFAACASENSVAHLSINQYLGKHLAANKISYWLGTGGEISSISHSLWPQLPLSNRIFLPTPKQNCHNFVHHSKNPLPRYSQTKTDFPLRGTKMTHCLNNLQQAHRYEELEMCAKQSLKNVRVNTHRLLYQEFPYASRQPRYIKQNMTS